MLFNYVKVLELPLQDFRCVDPECSLPIIDDILQYFSRLEHKYFCSRNFTHGIDSRISDGTDSTFPSCKGTGSY